LTREKPDRDLLAGYDALLQLWRACSFDFPLACAATLDTIIAENVRHRATLFAGMAKGGNLMEWAAQQTRFAEATVVTLSEQAKRLEKDLELALKLPT
jgi:hypothetical protein